MINFFKNLGNTLAGRYHYHPEAVIIACYYNSQDNPYRKIAFDIWYESIKHLNHRIIECTINGSEPQLPKSEFIKVIDSSSMLWHKETLLNLVISELPAKFKYVFWLDTDVLFTNKKWLTESVGHLQSDKLVQPFEYCAHLNQDETTFTGPLSVSETAQDIVTRLKNGEKVEDINCWRSFCANNASHQSSCNIYDIHGHVGFAWGARREVLDEVPLFDKALIGGADHIIAHAGAGHINHSCIAKTFTDNIDEVNEWSRRFFSLVRNKIGYAEGDLLHIWHGDIKKREYYQRIKEFNPTTKTIQERDANGLFITDDDTYVKNYFDRREVKSVKAQQDAEDRLKEQKRRELRTLLPDKDDSFIESLLIGYMTDSSLIGSIMGGNPLGAIVGDMLNNNDATPEPTGFEDGFGGGGFSGGGAGGDFNDTPTTDDTQSNNDDYQGSTFS